LIRSVFVNLKFPDADQCWKKQSAQPTKYFQVRVYMLAVHAGSAFFVRQVDARAVRVYRETDLPTIAGQQDSRVQDLSGATFGLARD